MNQYAYIASVVELIDLSGGRTPPGSIDGTTLRLIAQQLDRVLVSPDALKEYLVELRRQLRPLHLRYHVDPVSSKPKSVDDLPYLRPLADDVAAEILDGGPLARRSDGDLMRLRIDLISVNPAALQCLADNIDEELPPTWMPLLREELATSMRRDGRDLDSVLADICMAASAGHRISPGSARQGDDQHEDIDDPHQMRIGSVPTPPAVYRAAAANAPDQGEQNLRRETVLVSQMVSVLVVEESRGQASCKAVIRCLDAPPSATEVVLSLRDADIRAPLVRPKIGAMCTASATVDLPYDGFLEAVSASGTEKPHVRYL